MSRIPDSMSYIFGISTIVIMRTKNRISIKTRCIMTYIRTIPSICISG